MMETVLDIIRDSGPIKAAKIQGRIGSEGLSHQRIGDIVGHLRTEGHPICHSNNGYHYARTADDLSNTIANLHRRGIACLEQERKMLKAQACLRLGKPIEVIQPSLF